LKIPTGSYQDIFISQEFILTLTSSPSRSTNPSTKMNTSYESKESNTLMSVADPGNLEGVAAAGSP